MAHHQSLTVVPAHSHDYVLANEVYFDAQALKREDRSRQVQLARRVCNAVRQAYPKLLDDKETELMDFACGTGLISRELCSHVKSIVGIDISQNAVDVYNARTDQQGIPPEEMRALRIELKGDGGELDGARFDVIISVASYHHIPDIHATTQILSSFLKPGGSLLVADILKEPDSAGAPQTDLLEKYKDIVVHRSGFAEGDLREVMEQAGLDDLDFRIVANAILHGRNVNFFLMRGILPCADGR